MPQVNSRSLARTRIFSKIVFSLYVKIRLLSFWRDQNHHSNLTSKIMKLLEEIIEKILPKEFRKQLGHIPPKFQKKI